jgi:hypothetical protein
MCGRWRGHERLRRQQGGFGGSPPDCPVDSLMSAIKATRKARGHLEQPALTVDGPPRGGGSGSLPRLPDVGPASAAALIGGWTLLSFGEPPSWDQLLPAQPFFCASSLGRSSLRFPTARRGARFRRSLDRWTLLSFVRAPFLGPASARPALLLRLFARALFASTYRSSLSWSAFAPVISLPRSSCTGWFAVFLIFFDTMSIAFSQRRAFFTYFCTYLRGGWGLGRRGGGERAGEHKSRVRANRTQR